MTLSDAMIIFIQNLYDIGLSPNTISSYNTDLKQFIGQIGSQTKLDTLTYPLMSEFFSYLHTKKLAHATLKRKRVVIQRFLTFCYEKRLCLENHAVLIDPMRTKQTSKPKEILNGKEISVLITYLNDQVKKHYHAKGIREMDSLSIACRNRLLIYILLYTGCRANEAVSIKKNDISIPNNTIGILAKGSKYNNIPIHHKLSKALKQYEEDQSFLKQLGYQHPESIYLFPSKRKKTTHLSTRTLYDLMMELSGILGRNIHAHLFRHTFASYSIASGMNVATLASIISHSSPAITLSIYTHEIESRQKQEEMKKLQFEF